MDLSLKCLASGSSGNAFLLQGGPTSILIDCGLPARHIVTYLGQRNIDPRSLEAIFVTHEHTDHIKGLGTMSRRYGVPVICNEATLKAAQSVIGNIAGRPVPTGATTTVGKLDVTSFPVSHDAADPVGLYINYAGQAICFMTDLGLAASEIVEPFELADMVVLEANHDVNQLLNGPYPRFLKERVRGKRGHLSNAEAGELAVKAAGTKPKKIWLAHLSAVNNSPSLALNTVQNQIRAANIATVSVEVTRRDVPSLFWSAASSGWQPGLI